MCACVRECARAYVRACVRAGVCARARLLLATVCVVFNGLCNVLSFFHCTKSYQC